MNVYRICRVLGMKRARKKTNTSDVGGKRGRKSKKKPPKFQIKSIIAYIFDRIISRGDDSGEKKNLRVHYTG